MRSLWTLQYLRRILGFRQNNTGFNSQKLATSHKVRFSTTDIGFGLGIVWARFYVTNGILGKQNFHPVLKTYSRALENRSVSFPSDDSLLMRKKPYASRRWEDPPKPFKTRGCQRCGHFNGRSFLRGRYCRIFFLVIAVDSRGPSNAAINTLLGDT